MKTVTITVTQKDFDRAKAFESDRENFVRACQCPIANATKRIFHNKVYVTSREIGVLKYPKGKLHTNQKFMMNDESRRVMHAFDSKQSIKLPVTFTLTKSTS